ncbi:efflux RND transporter permease subunit [Frigidibacter sp. MR17.14]|uniref:efflux RND transporter permease subunit n=1 Tax=Frigidibacter sp. MR17.14 TaxID=3126509 RepID=UPI003012FC20
MSGPDVPPDKASDPAPAAEPAAEPGAASRNSTALLVRRPVLSFVVNALIVIAGLAAFSGAEIRELPDVDRPVVTISTDFDGASPETVDREVTGEIEGAAGRVSGVKSISSTSRSGSSRVTVEFSDDVDLDVAASDLRDAVARIANNLPDDADDPRIVKADADSDPVMRVSVTSAGRSPQDLTQIVQDLVEDRLISAPGVADVQIYGEREPVFRVDIDMKALAARGLTLADVRNTLATMNFDAPAGSLGAARQSLQVRAMATVTTPEQFEALRINQNVRLGDVAQVTLGPDSQGTVLRSNGQTGIGIGIIRQAQSNTLQISDAVRGIVDDLATVLPADVKIFVSSDSADFIRGAIHEVEIALVLSVVIVTAVIWLFLRDWRATLIPTIAMPVALIGTIAAVWMVGFSINILTLLALVLATGMVVDDAIVVLENIVRRRAEGMGARAAAVLGTQQVFFAVIATTTTLAAVFIPLSFLPGQTGGLFREFGFTLAISVLLSSVTALTLCPVLASRVLRRGAADAGSRGLTGRFGALFARGYARSLHWALDAPMVVLVVAALFAAMAWLMAGGIEQELTPPEDRGTLLLSVTAPQGVSLDYTSAKVAEIETLAEPLRASGEVVSTFAYIGTGGRDNRAFLVMTLAPWGERARSQQEIAAEFRGKLSRLVGVRAFVVQPNSLGIRGAGQGLSFSLVGDDYAALSQAAQTLQARMSQDPGFGQVRVDYDTTQPQLSITVDRERASDLGIDIAGLGQAIRAVLDGTSVGTVFLGDRSHDVKMMATMDPVDDPGDLERIFMRTRDGQMIPASAVVSLKEEAIAPELERESQLRSVPMSAGLEGGYALGAGLAEVERLAREALPPGIRVLPRGEAATLTENNQGLWLTFGTAILIVLLVLAAQFESFVAAFIVMATVPFGLACAVVAMVATGGSLNVYSQIGLVLLVGIMAKNGILIVEFANQLRDHGAGVRAAIEGAAVTRLRPVMMTMVATVIGGVPLVLAKGAGAEAREVLGWIIVGGLGLATVVTLYITPVAYLLLARLTRPKVEEEARLLSELGEAAGLKPKGTPAG